MKKIILITVCLVLISSFALALEKTLSWSPPLKSVDGSDADDLAGYKVYHGVTDKTELDVIDVKDDPNYYVTHLPEGETHKYKLTVPDDGRTHFYAVTAYDIAGNESDKSRTVSITTEDKVCTNPPKDFKWLTEGVEVDPE